MQLWPMPEWDDVMPIEQCAPPEKVHFKADLYIHGPRDQVGYVVNIYEGPDDRLVQTYQGESTLNPNELVNLAADLQEHFHMCVRRCSTF